MEIASWFLSAIGAVGVYVSAKNRWGWAIGFLYQVLWIVYAFYTKQYGFIWVCVMYAGLYAKNFYQGGNNAVGDADVRTSGVGEEHVG